MILLTIFKCFSGKIKIVLRAEGSDDPDKQGFCSIKVNGVERSAKLRGHNIVVLDDSGNFVTSKSFDTGDTSMDEGSAMARFLDGLPNERIVLIATQDTKGMTSAFALHFFNYTYMRCSHQGRI